MYIVHCEAFEDLGRHTHTHTYTCAWRHILDTCIYWKVYDVARVFNIKVWEQDRGCVSFNAEQEAEDTCNCDPLQENRTFAIFLICILGMDRHRIYCRVKEPGSKKVPRPSYGLKIVHRSPVCQSTIFGKRSILYVHSSIFNLSMHIIYALYHTMLFVKDNEFAGKDGHRQSTSTAVLVLRSEKQWTLSLVSFLCSFVQLHSWVWFLTTWSTSVQLQGI